MHTVFYTLFKEFTSTLLSTLYLQCISGDRIGRHLVAPPSSGALSWSFFVIFC